MNELETKLKNQGWVQDQAGGWSHPSRRAVDLIEAEAPTGEIITIQVPSKRRIRQSHKPLINKLESEYFEIIKRKWCNSVIHAQALRFRLGNGIWYKPDFALMNPFICWEVKGPHAFRGGFENLKVAASLYTEISWHLAWKESGTWKEQIVMP